MMAALFGVFALAMTAIWMEKRTWAIGFILAGLVLCWMMLGYHATDHLKINW